MLRLLQKRLKCSFSSSVCKLLVARKNQSTKVFYVASNITFEDFLKKIKGTFKVTEAISLTCQKQAQNKLAYNKVDCTKQYFRKPVLQSLMNETSLRITQNQDGSNIYYSIDIKEHNLFSSKMPTRISKNILSLLNEAESKRLTIKQFFQDDAFLGKRKPINSVHLNNLLFMEDQKQTLKKLKNNSLLTELISNNFINITVGVSCLNWFFLFVVTYGKYGWDVGEPISYTISLFMDLMAAIGVFNIANSGRYQVQNQHSMISINNSIAVRENYLNTIKAINFDQLI